ncbi:MAG TPA: ribonuclease P [Candidatus Nanoarchaeia archaeon]|nr:ribonuclease P [Candidatus Nanoarchaeia archaeon]
MKKKLLRKIKEKAAAELQIPSYFTQAEEAYALNPGLAHDYVRKARRLAMRYRIRLGKAKRKFCSHCYHYLMPGKNSRIRIQGGKVVIYCLDCKRFTRIPLA